MLIAIEGCDGAGKNTQTGLLADRLRAIGREATLEALRRCDALILVPGWEESKGTVAEVAEAVRLGIPVFTRVEEVQAWLLAVPHGG